MQFLLPKLSDDVKTIGEALDQFDSILSASYEYDRFTHGFGPGAAWMHILKLKQFLGMQNLNQELLDHNSDV